MKVSKEWFIKAGGQVCLKAGNGELNGWDTQSLVDCLNGKELKIADLEAKLAEITEKYNACQEARKLESEFSQQDKKELIQQLAEAKKEISEYVVVVDDLHKQLSNKCDFCEETHNQDKILLTMEQLEKVKEFVKENESWEIEGSDYSIVYADDVLDQIDNQIAELKKEGK